MKIGRIDLGAAALLFFAVAAAMGQTKEAVETAPIKKARVLVLGMVHMANPGRVQRTTT